MSPGACVHVFEPYFPFPSGFLAFENDFPSNPGRPLEPLFFDLIPLRLSLRRSLRMAMLSVRFFCLAAMEAVSCSLRSSLGRYFFC